MDGAALVFGIGVNFAHCLQYAKTLIPNHELYALKPAALEPLKEIDPAGLVLLHPFGGAQNLTIAVSFTAIATRIATFSYSPPQLRRR